MFSYLVNAVTTFTCLKSQRKTASIGTASSRTPTTIKVYREEVDLAQSPFRTLSPDPTTTPKVRRSGRTVENINVFARWETPFVIKPTSVDIQRGIGPILSKLPGEIRNIIYSDLLSSGHPQFLRASKALHIEGTGMVAENGVYRMSFGFHNRTNYALPSQRIVDTIRNLDIRANLSGDGGSLWTHEGPPDIWLLQAFGGSGLVRGQCDVSFHVHTSCTTTHLMAMSSALRLLSDFETVTVRAELDWPEPTSRINGTFGSLLWKASTVRFKPAPWSDFKFHFFFGVLRLDSTLGMGRLEQDEDGLRLVLHPRKALEEAEQI